MLPPSLLSALLEASMIVLPSSLLSALLGAPMIVLPPSLLHSSSVVGLGHAADTSFLSLATLLEPWSATQICSTPSPDCRRLDFVFGRFFWATWSDVGRPYGDIWARIVQNRIEKLVQASAKDSFKKLDNRGRRLTNTPKMAVWVGDAK